jgi:hypothetical protein
MDYNSNKNQQIKADFVNIHVHACVTGLVDFILAIAEQFPDAPLSYDDDWQHPFYLDMHGNELHETEREEKIVELREQLESIEQLQMDNIGSWEYDEPLQSIQNELSILEDADQEYPEIYEWWIVSAYLSDKLEQHNQSVINDGLNCYWGRRTTGQAILLDHVISQICAEMEILEHQKNAWLG